MSRRITAAHVTGSPQVITDPMPVVEAWFDDQTSTVLFSYFPEEVQFTPGEFIGLTQAEAMQLYITKTQGA